jgi:hypothetical protein
VKFIIGATNLPRVVSAPRFAYERRVQCSTMEIWQNQGKDKIKQ